MLSRKTSGRILITILLSAFLMLLNACAGLSHREDSIRVNLSSLRMMESTLFEQRFETRIRVQNRSQSELEINGLSFDLSLNGKDFASGVSNQEITINPLSEGVIAINLTSTLFSIFRQVRSIQTLQSKPFSYHLHGSIYTDNNLFGISFSEKGEIDLTAPAETAENPTKGKF